MKLHTLSESFDYTFLHGTHANKTISFDKIISRAARVRGQILNNKEYWDMVFAQLEAYIPRDKLVEFFRLTAAKMDNYIE